MARRRRHVPLRVLLNDRLVGHLHKAPGGEIGFRYDESWLAWQPALPVSLSLPLREEAYRGEPVVAVFENLLPDSDDLRRRVAERVGAGGTDAYGLLAAIGRDCVGALQFVASEEDRRDDPVPAATTAVRGEVLDEGAIEKLLKGLRQTPLGLSRDDEFRISVAGAQEKTALLWSGGKWLKPHGTAPTTHILKPRIGELGPGVDFSDSVENEWYCLKLAAAFGLPVCEAEIRAFGETAALVVRRFDRRWRRDGRLLRLPQEDFCQALSVPPARKYQSEGGPGLGQILDLLKGSDRPAEDRVTVLEAQILFWLIGATDGHAKNFSLFLGPGGSYRLTPLYDVLTAQPSLDAGQIRKNRFKLAMSVGRSRHYRIDEIARRHFEETGREAGLPRSLGRLAIERMADMVEEALAEVENVLPSGFPEEIHTSVARAVRQRRRLLATD